LGKATCQCWGPVGRRPILRRKVILSASLILEKNNWHEKLHGRGKATCKRKSSMHEEKKHARGATCKACGQENLTMIGIRFFIKIVMTIIL